MEDGWGGEGAVEGEEVREGGGGAVEVEEEIGEGGLGGGGGRGEPGETLCVSVLFGVAGESCGLVVGGGGGGGRRGGVEVGVGE